MKHILTIAGSDSSGGAGIQNDLKTISAHGHHGLTVITAVTAQNTTAVTDVFPVENVGLQLRALKEDIPIHAIKIGMLYTVDNVLAVIEFLLGFKDRQPPTVLDPLMYATTGRPLVSKEAMTLITDKLMPLCTLITPNSQECQALTGMAVTNADEAKASAIRLYRKTGSSVLLKGGHWSDEADTSTDLLYDGDRFTAFRLPRLKRAHTHGTGCCLSTALACRLAEGSSLEDGIRKAKDFITLAIDNGYSIGKGEGPVDPLIHFITNSVTVGDVANCCLAAGGRPIMAEAPEEMAEIAAIHQGLVINLGTITKDRLHTMTLALMHINPKTQKVLLDPVGCASSTFRLQGALDLLKTGKITLLKANAREGMALMGGQSHGAYGVDSDELDDKSKETLALDLYHLFCKENPDFTVIITGAADVIADSTGVETIKGGTAMQQKITGTGCMLNAVIMTSVAKGPSIRKAVIRAINNMNRASLGAARQLKNKKHLMTYRERLINELTAMRREVYLITDEQLDFENTLLPMTEKALSNGVGILQYRVKHKSREQRCHEANTLKKLCDRHGTTFIINDDVLLAKAVGADGVHLGIHDGDIGEARKILGDQCLIGATAKTVEQARRAEAQSADYLGVGALNPSPTKKDAIAITVQDLKDIRASVNIPIYGIGGIRHHYLTPEIVEQIDGVAIVSALYDGGMDALDRIMEKLH